MSKPRSAEDEGGPAFRATPTLRDRGFADPTSGAARTGMQRGRHAKAPVPPTADAARRCVRR